MGSMAEPAAPVTADVARHDVPRGGRSGYAIVDDRQVHYLEWGRTGAPPVLALHGGGQTAYMFEDLGAALRDTHHVLAPDLPNHGDSDGFEPDLLFSRAALAGTVPPLLDEFGLTRVVVVGASLGGITGVTLAASRPEIVAGLVLIDVGHRLETAGVERIIDFMRAHESFGSLEEAAADIAGYLPQRQPATPERLTRNLRQRPDGRWVWKHAYGRAGASEQQTRNWRDVIDGLDDDARLVDAPALVLRGAESDVLSPDGGAEIADLLPRGRLAVVEKAGHLAAGDNPHTTVGEIQTFLAELGW